MMTGRHSSLIADSVGVSVKQSNYSCDLYLTGGYRQHST
jgi:hypothetical protein